MSYAKTKLEQANAEIERLKTCFKTVHEQLDNAQATIEKKDALIKELAGALSKRLEPDKIRTLLDRALRLSPTEPQRRAAEMEVQRMARDAIRPVGFMGKDILGIEGR